MSQRPTLPPPPAATGVIGAAGSRTRLRRSRDARVIAGVAGGLARTLGVDPVLVRIAFTVLVFAGGAGVVAYGVLWLLVPVEGPEAAAAPRRRVTMQQGVALGLILLGALGLLRALGLWFGDRLVIPVLLAAVGSVIVWTSTDDSERARWSSMRARLPGGAAAAAAGAPTSPVRVAIGTVLIALAAAGFLAANDAFGALRDLGLALLAAAVGVVLLFGPWLWRLRDQLGEERRDRIRQEERAELAAHLHDSVLQTLALIQRASDDPRRMVTLARQQERELRSWLYGTTSQARDGTLATALEQLTEELEATYAVPIEVVAVGDAPLDADLNALLAAIREACTNAAKHAGTDVVDVYVETTADEVVAFVRDRGVGFDPARVPADRQGVRSSIVERVERHGGTATLASAPGRGTEVELTLPRRRTAPTDASLQAARPGEREPGS
jgi:phage shock protein PspC (stress-responsive transcriptional regulator)/two-component sensor histidine kinase